MASLAFQGRLPAFLAATALCSAYQRPANRHALTHALFVCLQGDNVVEEHDRRVTAQRNALLMLEIELSQRKAVGLNQRYRKPLRRKSEAVATKSM